MSYPELTPGMLRDAEKYLGQVPCAVTGSHQFYDECLTHYGRRLWDQALQKVQKPVDTPNISD